MRKPYPDDLTDQEWNVIEPIQASIKQIKGVFQATQGKTY